MQLLTSDVRPSGVLGLRVLRRIARPIQELTLDDVDHYGRPRRGLPDEVNDWRARNQRHLERGLSKVRQARELGVPHFYGVLWLQLNDLDLGLASLRVVTTAGVGAIVDAFQNTFELENFKYHALGTGSVAEAVADTALGAELTTQYQVDLTRPTGSTTEAAANAYRTAATITVDGAASVTEHGIFSQALSPGGVLLDRTVFAAQGLGSGDSLTTTYDLTFNAGG